MKESDSERAATAHKIPSRISMHEGTQDEDDYCTCGAEPYWLEAMEREPEAKGIPANGGDNKPNADR